MRLRDAQRVIETADRQTSSKVIAAYRALGHRPPSSPKELHIPRKIERVSVPS